MSRKRQKKTTASRIKFWALISLLVMGGAARGDTIELRSAVRLDVNDRIVNLGDIADLTGPQARQLADLVVAELDDPGAVLELSVREVRARLNEAGVHWGLLQLNGRTVVIRPGRGPGVSALIAMQGAAIRSEQEPESAREQDYGQSAEELAALPTLRGAIASFIAAGLRRPPDEVRLVFDRGDDAVLDLPRHVHRVEIEPAGSLLSDRLGLNLRLWDGVTIAARHDVTVRLLVRTEVAIPARDIARQERLAEPDVLTEHRWLRPTEAALAARARDAVGHHAARRLQAGAPIARTAVQRETVVRRGDHVIVRCLVGGTVIALQAEARGDGSEGDTIEFRKKGERAVFLATVTGPGEAVIDLSAR